MASFTENLTPNPLNSLYSYGGGYNGNTLPTFQNGWAPGTSRVAQPLSSGFSGVPIPGGAATPTDPNSWMPDWLRGAIGSENSPGWGGMAIGGLQALGGFYNSMQQYGLAKDTLAENKRQFQLNYDNQKQLTNQQMEDRQRARASARSSAEPVDSYMARWGIK